MIQLPWVQKYEKTIDIPLDICNLFDSNKYNVFIFIELVTLILNI